MNSKPTLSKDQTYTEIGYAYGLLELLVEQTQESVQVNRSYIRDEYVNLNFTFKGCMYMLHTSYENDGKLVLQVWKTHNGVVLKKDAPDFASGTFPELFPVEKKTKKRKRKKDGNV